MFQWLSVFKGFNGFNDIIGFNCYNNFNGCKGFNDCIWSLLKQINKNSYHTITWLYYTYNIYLNNHFKYFYQKTTKSIRFDVKYISARIKHHTAVTFPELFTAGGVIIALYLEPPQVFSNIYFLLHGQHACNTLHTKHS